MTWYDSLCFRIMHPTCQTLKVLQNTWRTVPDVKHFISSQIFFFFFLQLGLKHKFGLFHKFVNKNQRKKMNLPFLKAQLECFIIINSKAISIHRGHLSKKYIPYILTDKQTNKQRMNLIHSLTMFLKQSLPSSWVVSAMSSAVLEHLLERQVYNHKKYNEQREKMHFVKCF